VGRFLVCCSSSDRLHGDGNQPIRIVVILKEDDIPAIIEDDATR
jgi:hypothetical protein